jgi:predicted NBD/HSP70 family sugar kinase
VVLYAHEGIGAGLVLGGNLHRGARGAAGEVAYRECSPLPNPIVQPEPEIYDMFAWGVCALVNLLNPEVCLLTGDLHGLRNELVPRIEGKLKHFTNPVARDVAICSKPCDPMEVALHMATIVLDDLFFQSGENLQSLTMQQIKAAKSATNHLAQRTLQTAQ